MDQIAVIDFETTGLFADTDRATEIAVVILENNRVVGRFESLMNGGIRIPSFIEELTGISNAMVLAAPPAAEVMWAAADFVGDMPLLAHNASFDQRFWDAEISRIGRRRSQVFACSMLLSRRLIPEAPNHRLGTLNTWARLPGVGKAHRALADAEMAANLTVFLLERLRVNYGVRRLSHELLCRLQRVSAAKVCKMLEFEIEQCRV